MRRIVVLGTGTGVGKTYFTTRLVRALASDVRQANVIGIKAVETGFRRTTDGAPPKGSDAAALEVVSRGTPIRPHPLVVLPHPISAHLAARRARTRLSIPALVRALDRHAAGLDGWQIVETAGGVFSPLTERRTNLDFARALEPATWLLVAPDALGVLHDVRATLLAMKAVARAPDHLVLSAARGDDASVGTNAAELARVGLQKPIAVLADGASDDVLASLLRALRRRR